MQVKSNNLRPEGLDRQVIIPAFETPRIQVLSSWTGTGKTLISLVSGLHTILDRAAWENVKQSGEERLNSSTINPYTNVIFESEVSASQCARVLIVAAPPRLVTSWHDTMRTIVDDVKAFYETEVHVWLYFGRAARDQSMRRALELGEPVVWFVPLKGNVLQEVMGAFPDVHYGAMIRDENNNNPRDGLCRYSKCFGTTFIVQATIPLLQMGSSNFDPLFRLFQTSMRAKGGVTSTPDIVNNLLYQLGHQRTLQRFEADAVSEMMAHLSLRAACVPSFVRRAVSVDAMACMPARIVMLPLVFHTAGMLNREATMLSPISLDTFLENTFREYHLSSSASQNPIVTSLLSFVRTTIGESLPAVVERLKECAALEELPRNVKSSFARLSNRIEESCAQRSSCVVCYDDITELANVRISQCCTGIYCKDCFKLLRGRCGLCRATIEKPLELELAPKPSRPMVAVDPQLGFEENTARLNTRSFVKPERALTDALDMLLGVANARVVVYHARLFSNYESRNVTFAREYCTKTHGADVFSFCHDSTAVRSSKVMLDRFNSDAQAKVCTFLEVISGRPSTEIFGLDFHSATGIVIDCTVNSDQLTQLIGRVLRYKPGRAVWDIPVVVFNRKR